MNNTHNQENNEIKNNLMNSTFNKIKEDIKSNSMYVNLEDEKIKEFINQSYDEIINEENCDTEIEIDDIYTNSITKINNFLCIHIKTDEILSCEVFNCCTKKNFDFNEQYDDFETTNETTETTFESEELNNEIKTEPKNEKNSDSDLEFKISNQLMDAMDEPNKEVAHIINEKGMMTALDKMTENVRNGTMSYSEMRALYG